MIKFFRSARNDTINGHVQIRFPTSFHHELLMQSGLGVCTRVLRYRKNQHPAATQFAH